MGLVQGAARGQLFPYCHIPVARRASPSVPERGRAVFASSLRPILLGADRLLVTSIIVTVLHFGGAPPALAEEPGAIRHSFPPSVGAMHSRWAFDDTLGRHYFIGYGSIRTTDRDGNEIRTWSIGRDDGRDEFFNALGSVSAGALFVTGGSTFYLLGEDRTTMTVWGLTDLGEGKGAVALRETLDFSLVLPGAGATAIDRAADGSWWIISSGSIYNINPQGTAIRRSVTFEELGAKVFGGQPFHASDRLIAVDPVSGALYLHHSGLQYQSFAHGRYYRIDNQSLLTEGRFAAGAVARIAGTRDGFVAFGTELRERALPAQDLPDVTSVSFDQEGVMWTYCPSTANELVTVTFGTRWGEDAGPYQQVESGPLLIGSIHAGGLGPEAQNSFSRTFPRSRLNDYPPFPWTMILLLNDKDQISTPIPVNLPLAAYAGPIMFMPGCTFWISEVTQNKKVTWSWGGVAPKEPFNAWVEFAHYVPWVGDKRYGIKDVQASGQGQIASQDDGSVAVSGGGEFLLGPGKLRTEFGGGIIQSLTPEGPEIGGGLLTMSVAGSVSQEAGLVDVFPQLAPLKTMRFLSGAFNWLNDRAKLTATITIGLDSSTKVTLSDEKDILFEGEMTAFLALGVAAAVNLIGGYAEVSAYGEGKGSATLTPSSDGLALKELAITALVGAKLRAWVLERSVERVISISTVDGVTTSKELPNGGVISDSGWQYAYGAGREGLVPKSLPMPYVVTPNPFAEFDSHKSTGFPVTGSHSFDREVRVLGGIPPDATLHTTMHPENNTMMVVWAQPIPGNPATQATDIWYSYFNGAYFSIPAPIHTDDRAAFNPKVEVHRRAPWGEDQWVALWERNGIPNMHPSGNPEADTETIVANLRPTYSIFVVETGVWSEPREIPIEGANGFNTQLASVGKFVRGGPLYACWLESDTGNLLPWDLNAPDPSQGRIGGVRLRYAPLSGTWQDGELVSWGFNNISTLGEEDPDVDTPEDVVEYSAATSDNWSGVGFLLTRMADVHSVDPFRPTMVLEVWQMRWGVSDTRLRRLQRSTVQHKVISNPRVHPDRSMGVVWEDELYISGPDPHSMGIVSIAQNPVSGYPPVRPTYERVEFAADDPARPQGAETQSYTLSGVLPDPAVSHWFNLRSAAILHKPDERGNLKLHMGAPNRTLGPITHGTDTERHATAIVTDDGHLLTMYQKVPMRRTPVTVKIDGVEQELVRIEEEDATYFAMSRRIVATELMAGEVRHRSGFFLPGHTITLEAEVHNVGDLPVRGLKMSLYALPEGSKGDDLIPIIENELVLDADYLTLNGNDTAVKRVEWTVPDDRAYSFIMYVDPDNEIDEFDNNNNVRESFVPVGLVPEVAEWLIGRLVIEPPGLDRNEDGVIDAADTLD